MLVVRRHGDASFVNEMQVKYEHEGTCYEGTRRRITRNTFRVVLVREYGRVWGE